MSPRFGVSVAVGIADSMAYIVLFIGWRFMACTVLFIGWWFMCSYRVIVDDPSVTVKVEVISWVELFSGVIVLECLSW